MQSKDFEGRHVFTRSIAAASALVALGIPLREQLPVTVTREGPKEDTVFWFRHGPVQIAGLTLGAGEWLRLLLCPWPEFKVSLDHPVAYLKASAENRQVLLKGVQSAQGRPFRVVRRPNRTVVIGAGVSEENARRLINQG